jgi:hypothetical protein
MSNHIRIVSSTKDDVGQKYSIETRADDGTPLLIVIDFGTLRSASLNEYEFLGPYRDIDDLLSRYMPRIQSFAEDRYERKKYTEMNGHCLIQIPSWSFGINWFPW